MSVRAVVDGVSVKLGTVQALDSVHLTVEPGQFLALLGPSGSGKTTTLNVLAGFVRPDTGVVSFNSHDMTRVPPHRRDLGIVFQSYALFPHMSVEQNVEFPLRMRDVSRGDRRARTREALDLVSLGDQAGRSVQTLSGGQKQRVALARALVFEPRMMLLDEPLGALDRQLRDAMQLELRRLHQRLGITTVAVTHDQVEALTMADVVAVMRDGQIEQVASPEDLYLRPSTVFVALFLGDANLVPVSAGELAGFGRLGDDRTGHAVIRPEHLAISEHADDHGDRRLVAVATLEEVAFQGARLRARVRMCAGPGTEFTVSQPSGADHGLWQPGNRVHVGFDPRLVHVIPS